MHDSRYMTSSTVHMDDHISVGTPPSEDRHSSATSSASPYGSQDMARPYASVSPYSSYSSIPAYDSSLPTPVSVAGSPPMPERRNKMLSAYNQHGERSQRLTPPTTSRAWSYAPTMTSAPSDSMTVPSSAAEMLGIHHLESPHSPEQQSTVVDPTQHFHWSTYGVSSHDPTDELSSPPLPSQSLYPNVPPSMLMGPPYDGLPTPAQVALAPALSHISMPTHPADPRPLMAQHLQQQFDDLSNISLEFGQAYPARKSKARVNRSGRQLKRDRNMPPPSANNTDRGYNNGNTNPMTASTSSNIPESKPTEHLTFDDKAPEDSRFLLETRCQMSDGLGKGMWDHIQEAYKERYGRKTKEGLQMQLKRSVQSYAVWPKEEDQALKDAVEEYERRRYAEIRRIMKEKGGRRVWDWNDGNIAKRLVQLGVDEIDNRDQVKKARRKHKSTVRQKAGGEPWEGRAATTRVLQDGFRDVAAGASTIRYEW
ncbi:hypothetical protein F5Y14DRAFT_113297 [Nemania sp. NC0429]|nr:hypothetical protein F5Y14DRAFT_113297 [Nemania sp. NC0429]